MPNIKPNPQNTSTSHQEVLREKKCINSFYTRRRTLNYTNNTGKASNNTYNLLLNNKIGANYLKFRRSKSN